MSHEKTEIPREKRNVLSPTQEMTNINDKTSSPLTFIDIKYNIDKKGIIKYQDETNDTDLLVSPPSKNKLMKRRRGTIVSLAVQNTEEQSPKHNNIAFANVSNDSSNKKIKNSSKKMVSFGNDVNNNNINNNKQF